jgi:branched-chain amino acid transport system ATP-binding protein
VDITRWPPYTRNAGGLSLCPEGRRVFAGLTVRENLLAGGQALSAAERARQLDHVLTQLPIVANLLERRGGSLSGGEQQALAIGRALMSRPRILLLDEPSLGLSPVATESVFDVLQSLKQAGMAILLIEQNAHLALELADYAYVLSEGRILTEGPAAELAASSEIMEAYLGT